MLKSFIRKMRGALGTAVTWAVGWATVSVGALALLFVVNPDFGLWTFKEVAPMVAIMAGASGMMGGTVFAAVMGSLHGRRRLEDLSPFRMGLWGAAAGMLVPSTVVGWAIATGDIGLTLDVLTTTVVVFGGLGMATGAGTVKLAQMSRDELESGRLDTLGSGS